MTGDKYEKGRSDKFFLGESPAGGRHTEKEYLALPQDLRVELIDGVFYDMASPGRLHQRVVLEIARQLEDCIEKQMISKQQVRERVEHEKLFHRCQ